MPAGAAIVLSLIVKMIFRATPFGDMGSFITAVVSAPLTIAGTSYPGAMFATFIEQLLWSFGIHGSSVVTAVMEPIWLNANLENLAAFQAGATQLPHIITQTFIENFMWIGGSGATLPVVTYMHLLRPLQDAQGSGPAEHLPPVSSTSTSPWCSVCHRAQPFLMIPFIVSPLVIFTISYVGMYLNIFPRMVGVSIPWTTPYLISGYLATGGRLGGVLPADRELRCGVLYLAALHPQLG